MDLPVIFVSGGLLLLIFFIANLGVRFKIPDVITYILIGIVLASLVGESELLHLIGEIGIVLLFFMLGMEFPLKQLMKIAKKVTAAGTLDVLLNIVVTMGIVMLFGLGIIEALLIGGVVYATSSSITAKMLETSKRMANPESEFILGLLIFEDLVAPILVAILVGLTAGTALSLGSFSFIMFKVILLILGAVVLGQFVFIKLQHFFERHLNYDTFVLFVIGIALTYGGLAIYLDLSEVLGAFLAGIMIAEVRKTDHLEHLVLPIRDLTLPLFFVWFGTTIQFESGVAMIPLLITLSIWGIIAKLIVGIVGGRLYGLTKRVSFRAGFSLIQRGEFSIIIAALASAELMVFSSVIILSTAVIGIILFQLAPLITKVIYPQKKPDKVKLPG